MWLIRAIEISVRVTVTELLCYSSPLYTNIRGAHTIGGSLPTDMLTGHAAPRIKFTSVQHPQGLDPILSMQSSYRQFPAVEEVLQQVEALDGVLVLGYYKNHRVVRHLPT